MEQLPKDLYLAKTPEQQRYCRAGIPYRYWDPPPGKWEGDFTSITYQQLNGKIGSITAAEQAKAYASLLSSDEPSLIHIAGYPTDNIAMKAGMNLVKLALSEGTSAIVLDSGTSFYRDLDNVYVGMVVVHNLLESVATTERLQAVRDLLVRWSSSLRILISVTKDPVSLAFLKLGLPVNHVFYLEGGLETKKVSR